MNPKLSAFLSVILFLLTSIPFSDNAVPLDRETADQTVGLYSTKDDVEILTSANFNTKIFGSDRAWLVEFYNSWCGFCQRFAPSWKAFASDVKNWKDMVAVAAIDCANDDNHLICREFEVMAYPTLRYFHENYEEKPKNIGAKVAAGTTAGEHRHKLVEVITKEKLEGRGRQYPDLTPYTSKDISDVRGGTNSDKFAVLIVQQPESYLGQELALDLHTVPEVIVRFSYNNNTELVKTVGAKTIPALYVIEKDNAPQQLTATEADRDGFFNAVGLYLSSKGVKVERKVPFIVTPDEASILHDREQKELIQKIKKMGDVVFQMDLETALRYSLKQEVGNVKEITGEKLTALRKYVDVLAKYFPFGQKGHEFLRELRDYVDNSPVEGSRIRDIVREAEKDDSQVFSTPQQWLGCRGSDSTRRGYPCGLWKLFHYLTVNAETSSNPKIALEAMHGYIKNFFGCADCSRHFQEMAARRGIDKVSSFDGSILWLWKAHNEVNERLAGDKTEDPEFPKVQFPARERCPRCRNADGSFNEAEVLRYLKHVYGGINVSFLGADTRILHLGLDGTPVASGIMRTIDTRGV